MTEQQQLSQSYSNLKEKYQKLKEHYNMRGETTRKINEQIGKLQQKVIALEKQLETVKDDIVYTLPKGSAEGNYVSYKRYNKVHKLMEEYAQKYGMSERINIQLREENNKLKSTK